jgi:hypothetical protein
MALPLPPASACMGRARALCPRSTSTRPSRRRGVKGKPPPRCLSFTPDSDRPCRLPRSPRARAHNGTRPRGAGAGAVLDPPHRRRGYLATRPSARSCPRSTSPLPLFSVVSSCIIYYYLSPSPSWGRRRLAGRPDGTCMWPVAAPIDQHAGGPDWSRGGDCVQRHMQTTCHQRHAHYART